MSMMQKTFFIIKPEAFAEREKMKAFIESHSDLRVEKSAVMVLQDDDIKSLYLDDIGTDLQVAAKRHLVGRWVEAGVVSGENAIDEFIRLCGMHPDGRLCGEGTIRRVFGKKDIIMYGDTTYFLNAIHKSSRKEAESSVRWFYDKVENPQRKKKKGS